VSSFSSCSGTSTTMYVELISTCMVLVKPSEQFIPSHAQVTVLSYYLILALGG